MPEELSGRRICNRHKEIGFATTERKEKRDNFIRWHLWATADVKSLRIKEPNSCRCRWIYIQKAVALSELLGDCRGTMESNMGDEPTVFWRYW